MSLSLLLLAAMPVAWLLPNHYAPWLSAWQEGLTLALLAAAGLAARRGGRVPAVWLAFVAAAASTVLLQWAFGLVRFSGDALMVVLYLGAVAAAAAIGGSLRPAGDVDVGGDPLNTLAAGTAFCAVVSVGLALMQWTGVPPLGLWLVELRPTSRPHANVAQPNHLCTLLVLGQVALLQLQQSRRLSGPTFWLGSAWLLAGMAMSGSRTGWLQIAALAVMWILLRRRAGLRLAGGQVAALGALYLGALALWPWANEVLLYEGARGVGDQLAAGSRPTVWRKLVDAILLEPLTGYGWQQTVHAQLAVALEGPPMREHWEHAHSLALDLLIWSGIPIGLLLLGLMAYWFVTRTLACRDAGAALLLMGLVALLVHAMLEFPHEYAYFLLPAAVAVGAVESAHPAPAGPVVRAWMLKAMGGAIGATLVVVALDYLQAEQGFRNLRLESAGIGAPGLVTPPPELRVLDQLEAFQRFVHTEARPGMGTDDLRRLYDVAERFAYPPAMLRHALAAGLNGDPERARTTLQRLCHVHPPPRCEEAREAWAEARRKFPVLSAVPAPAMP